MRRGDRGQHRPFGQGAEFEPLLDDRDDGGADDLRNAANSSLRAGADAAKAGRTGAAGREAFEANGFVANMERFLIAASDHPNGRLASRLAGLLAGSRGQPATVLHVESEESGRGPQDQGRKMASDVRRGINRARETRPDEAAEMRDVAVKARPERATG